VSEIQRNLISDFCCNNPALGYIYPMKTKDYGVKFNDGTIVEVRAANMEMAKWGASRRYVGKVESIWEIGKYWDGNGQLIVGSVKVN
jgi:hypothetical protein